MLLPLHFSPAGRDARAYASPARTGSEGEGLVLGKDEGEGFLPSRIGSFLACDLTFRIFRQTRFLLHLPSLALRVRLSPRERGKDDLGKRLLARRISNNFPEPAQGRILRRPAPIIASKADPGRFAYARFPKDPLRWRLFRQRRR